MGKKIISITEKKLCHIINEGIKEALGTKVNENYDGSAAMKMPHPQEDDDMIVEMARINSNEQQGIFPYNGWEVKIWSNDHTPPHFHILKDGWDVSFLIDTGEILEVKSQGDKKKYYNYMIQNVSKWLESPCSLLPMISNRQNAYAQWVQIHNGI